MEDAKRLRFIKQAKKLGFSLNEIKDLLVITQDPNATKADIKARIDIKTENIRQKIYDLTRILAALEHLGESCDGHGSVEGCPILEFLTEDEDENQKKL